MSFNSCVSRSGLYIEIHNPEVLDVPSGTVLVNPPHFMTTISRYGSNVLDEIALRVPNAAVVGYDHPGTGKSASLLSDEIEALHSDTGYEPIAKRAWRDITEIVPDIDGRKLIVAGNSMGAYAGAHLIAATPEGVVIDKAILAEAAAILTKKKSVAEGLSKYMFETLVAQGKFPYDPTRPTTRPQTVDRLIDKDAAWAYIDAFRRTTARTSIQKALNNQQTMDLITIHGGDSLMSPRESYDDLVPEEHRSRWLDICYSFSRHNITDNGRVFGLMVASLLDDFEPLPEELLIDYS